MQTGDSLLFGSEIKTLLAHPAVPPRVDANGLAEVLLLGPGRTPGCGVFKNIRELLPGQCAVYEAEDVYKRQMLDHPKIFECFSDCFLFFRRTHGLSGILGLRQIVILANFNPTFPLNL